MRSNVHDSSIVAERGLPLLVVVTGATASGKTSLAIDLACHYSTEIVSADSRQIYRDIPIGTAAPTADECSRAVHHLVGVLPLDAYYSASQFEADALSILDGIWSRNHVAIVCGGSMMYIDALCRGLDDMPTVSATTRSYVRDLFEHHGLEGVLAQLRICDPDYWQVVDRQNTRRVLHGLEISLEAGAPYSSLRTGRVVERPFRVLKLAIERSRDELFERINARVEQMMEDGLEREAHEAFAKGRFNSLNTVGYKEMDAYFRGEMNYEEAVARIAKNTRVYAKKQLTWMKRDDSIRRLSPTSALKDAIESIDNKLNSNTNLE